MGYPFDCISELVFVEERIRIVMGEVAKIGRYFESYIKKLQES